MEGQEPAAAGKDREEVLRALRDALEHLRESDFARLIPEVGSNLAYSLPEPRDKEDVAAVPGRIRNAMGRPVFEPPRFGASSHVASIILGAVKRDPSRRSALNIRFSEEIVRALERMRLRVVFVDRTAEPPVVSATEGASVPWVITKACEAAHGGVPDVIFTRGALGKEAIVQLLGTTPAHVAGVAVGLAGQI